MSNVKGSNIKTALPEGLGKPAYRALAAANITCIEDLGNSTERDLFRLHGIGPKAVRMLKQCMELKNISFQKAKKS